MSAEQIWSGFVLAVIGLAVFTGLLRMLFASKSAGMVWGHGTVQPPAKPGPEFWAVARRETERMQQAAGQ